MQVNAETSDRNDPHISFASKLPFYRRPPATHHAPRGARLALLHRTGKQHLQCRCQNRFKRSILIDGLLRRLAGIQPVAIDERHERAGEIGQ
jgi:hypothetical protein